MVETQSFDEIIIGSGKGGKSLAVALANAGHKVALVEKKMIGGSCLNVACIPTKSLVASVKVLHQASRAADYGIACKTEPVKLADVIARKRRIVKTMVDNQSALFKATSNLLFQLGTAHFLNDETIEVATADGGISHFASKRIIINTGSKTTIPEFPGLSNVKYYTSTSIMELETLPSHLVILGAGYISLEFAQIFKRLGSKVTIVQRSERFLPNEDRDIAGEILTILRNEGIEVLLSAQVSELTPAPRDEVKVSISVVKEKMNFQASHLLVAVGRSSNNKTLELAAAGIKTDSKGYIKVDSKLETNVPGIFAIGDCNGGPHFTHTSWHDYRILKQNFLHDGKLTTENRLVPYTLFIDPELGRVGITETEARDKGLPIAVAKIPAAKVPRAFTSGENKGLIKAVVNTETKKILGCSVLAAEGGEIMAIIQVAMQAGLPYTELRDLMFAHPTWAESLNVLFDSLV